MNEEAEKLRHYLLGSLQQSDSEEFDLRIIEDEGFSADLALAESELAEDFLEGNLSGDELKLFNSNFLSSAKRNALVTEIAALKKEAGRRRRNMNAESETAERAPVSRSIFRPIIAFAAAAAVLVLAFVVWQAPWGNRPSPIETEYAKLNKQDLTDLEPFNSDTTFNLISGSLRGNNTPVSKNEPDLTRNILFRLALPSGEVEGQRYSIQLIKGSTVVFRQTDLLSYQNPGGRELRFILPRSVFGKGRFQLKIENMNRKIETGPYVFQID